MSLAPSLLLLTVPLFANEFSLPVETGDLIRQARIAVPEAKAGLIERWKEATGIDLGPRADQISDELIVNWVRYTDQEFIDESKKGLKELEQSYQRAGVADARTLLLAPFLKDP